MQLISFIQCIPDPRMQGKVHRNRPAKAVYRVVSWCIKVSLYLTMGSFMSKKGIKISQQIKSEIFSALQEPGCSVPKLAKQYDVSALDLLRKQDIYCNVG